MNAEQQFYIQLGLVLFSLLGLIPYILAYQISSRKNKDDSYKLPIRLYYISSYPSFIWLVMPFIEQPRGYGIFYLFSDYSNKNLFFLLFYCIICFLIFFYFCFIWGGKSIKTNISVTKDTFYAPKKLLTDGIYGKVRHPMISGDMIAHFSFILLLGALYTLYLYPFYIFYNLIIVKVQTKYSLEPYFSQQLKIYRKTTPGYLNKELGYVVLLLLALMSVNLFLTKM